MNRKTCFDILCISRYASLEEAKQSYRQLVKRWHPDQYGNDPKKQLLAHDKLKEINVAYRELVNLLKSRAGMPDLSQEPQTAKQRRSAGEPKQTRKPTFFRRMTSFFKYIQQDPIQRPPTEKQSKPFHASVDGTHNSGGGDTASNFSKVLKRAIHNQPRGIGSRQRINTRAKRSGSRRIHQSPGGYPISRTFAAPRRSRVDRVERIRRIRPVGRIGE